MGLQDLFHRFDKDKRKSHFKNLLAVAVVDHKLAFEEIDYVIKLAERCQISREEVKSVLKDPEAVKFKPPRKLKNRLDQIYDLVTVMVVDGEVDKREMALCKAFAIKLSFHPLIVDQLLSDLVGFAMQGVSLNQVLKKVPATLDNP